MYTIIISKMMMDDHWKNNQSIDLNYKNTELALL